MQVATLLAQRSGAASNAASGHPAEKQTPTRRNAPYAFNPVPPQYRQEKEEEDRDDASHLQEEQEPTRVVGNGTTYHDERKRQMLKAHPSLRNLNGADRRSTYLLILTCLLHLAASAGAAWAKSWPVTIALAYLLGNVFLGIFRGFFHDAMHCTLWPRVGPNNWLAILTVTCNPWTDVSGQFVAWRDHVSKHHQWTGTAVDPDTIDDCYEMTVCRVPFVEFIQKHWTQRVALWVGEAFLQALRLSVGSRVAAVRLMVSPRAARQVEASRRPQVAAAGQWLFLGVVAAVALLSNPGPDDSPSSAVLHAVAYTFVASLANTTCCFFTASSFFNGSDHFLTGPNQPTFGIRSSLYNVLSLGYGFHNEHHEFPCIPVWKTWQVSRVAPEFYPRSINQTIGERLSLVFVRRFDRAEIQRQQTFLEEMDRGTRVFSLAREKAV